jgi:hypothetical protein
VFVKQLIFLIFLFALLASCVDSKPDAVPNLDASPTAVQGVLATAVREIATPFPIMVTVTQNRVEPTATPTATKNIPVATRGEELADIPSSGFSDLHFALAADGAAQNVFPSGTDEVYALWEYTGMSPTDNIRRIWFRDDQIWLTREEGWEWSKYGGEGTMRDLSVYDNEGSGLASATYRLQLYVNDKLQQEATFVVQAP